MRISVTDARRMGSRQGMYGPWTEADTKTVGKILLGFSQVCGASSS